MKLLGVMAREQFVLWDRKHFSTPEESRIFSFF